jgi:hypothetical protein
MCKEEQSTEEGKMIQKMQWIEEMEYGVISKVPLDMN